MVLPGRELSEVTSLPSQPLINSADFAVSAESEGSVGEAEGLVGNILEYVNSTRKEN